MPDRLYAHLIVALDLSEHLQAVREAVSSEGAKQPDGVEHAGGGAAGEARSHRWREGGGEGGTLHVFQSQNQSLPSVSPDIT